MEQNNRRFPRRPVFGAATLRNAAAKFVATRFDADSQALLQPKGALRIASYSTVTVSGASSAGLDRCAYSLGKWQSSVVPATHNTRSGNDDQISNHFPAIERQVSARKAAKQPAAGETQSAETVANFEDYAKRLDYKPANDKFVETASLQQANDTSNTNNRLAVATDVSTACGAEYVGEERRLAGDRREFSAATLLLCLKNPQRINGRRKSDSRYPLLDIFDSSAMFLAVALTTLSLCDAFFTLNILAHGGQEVNPIMNYMLGYGTFAFVASKMLFTAVGVIMLTGASNLLLFNRIRIRSILAILTGLYAALIVYELMILAIA